MLSIMEYLKLSILIFVLWFLTGPFETAAQGFHYGVSVFALWYLYGVYYWVRDTYRMQGYDDFDDEEDHELFDSDYKEWKKNREYQAQLSGEQRRRKSVHMVLAPTPISPLVTPPRSFPGFTSWTKSFKEQQDELNASPAYKSTPYVYSDQAKPSYTLPPSPPQYDCWTSSPPQIYKSVPLDWCGKKLQKSNNLLFSTPSNLGHGQRDSTITELMNNDILRSISIVRALRPGSRFFDKACLELAQKLVPVIDELKRLSRCGVSDRKTYLLNVNFPLSDLNDVYLYVSCRVGAASDLKRKIEDISYMFSDDQEKVVRNNFGIISTTPLNNAGGMIYGVQGAYSNSQSTASTSWGEFFGSTNSSLFDGSNAGSFQTGTLATNWSDTPQSGFQTSYTKTSFGGQSSSLSDGSAASSFGSHGAASFGGQFSAPPDGSTPGQNTTFGQPSATTEQRKAPDKKPLVTLGGHMVDDSEAAPKKKARVKGDSVFGVIATTATMPHNWNNPFTKFAENKPSADLVPAAWTQQPANNLFSAFLPKPAPGTSSPSFAAHGYGLHTPKSNPFLAIVPSHTPVGTPSASSFGFQQSKVPGTFGTGATKDPIGFVSGGFMNQSFQQTKTPDSFGVGGDKPSRIRRDAGDDKMW